MSTVATRRHGPAKAAHSRHGTAKAGHDRDPAGHARDKLSKDEVLTAYRRAALLESASRVFGECGFERATMERIAREADVAKGTVYLYYASKQSIYDAALNGGFAELDQRTRARIEHAGTLREAISAFVTTRAEFFLERRDFFRMYVAAIARQVTDVNARPSDFASMVERQTRRLEAAVARAMARREIRAVDPAATALAIFDLTRGLVARRLIADAGPDFAGDAAFLSDLIWRGLVTTRDAGAAPRVKGRRTGPQGHRTRQKVKHAR